jgi:hypothetical protein
LEEKKKIPEEVKIQMVAVLKEYCKLGVIGRACDLVGVPRRKHRDWLEEYPTYRARFEEFKDRFVDTLELTAIDRAKEKSDSLLWNILKAQRPEVYGDRTKVEHTVAGQGIQLIFAESMLNEEEKKILKGEPTDGKEEC